MEDLQVGVGGTPASDGARTYAKLAVRVRAAMYDSMIFIVTVMIIISLALSSNSEAAARVIGVIGIVLVVLYEPVMVWRKGGTLGHIVCNLRVVDDRTLGNPSFLRASLRFTIKAVLGWFSFITIMASRRLRAIHDVLTGSTVQIRNVCDAKGYDFTKNLSNNDELNPYSILRRAFSIVIYLIVSFLILALATGVFIEFNLISDRCVSNEHCSVAEHLILNLIGLSLLASLFVIIGFGWRGQLFGFRGPKNTDRAKVKGINAGDSRMK
jgi:uncharacterized RDD family membrane protein YckC